MSNENKILQGIARLEGNLESVKEDVSAIKLEDSRQNRLLAEHIAGVKSNTARLDLERITRQEALERHEQLSKARMEKLESRLNVVEFLPNLAKDTWKLLKWLGIAAGSIAAISKFFDFW